MSRKDAGDAPRKMKNKEYQRELRVLHGELVALQEWVKATQAKVCIVFEGVNADRNGERAPAEKGSTSVRSYLAARASSTDAVGLVRRTRALASVSR